MRKAVLGLMLGSVVAVPAHAERFAISCSGKSMTGIVVNNQLSPKTTKIKDIVYVIDEEAKTVHRLIPKQNILEEVCGLRNMQCSRAFSAEQITISGSMTEMRGGERPQEFRTIVSFDWNRKTNRLETVFDMFASSGVGIVMRWSLKCVPAPLPAAATPTSG